MLSTQNQRVSKRSRQRSIFRKKRLWSVLLLLICGGYLNAAKIKPEVQEPEFITSFPTIGEMQGPDLAWQSVTVERGDSLAIIFSRLGLSPAELFEIMSMGSEVADFKKIKPHQELRFQIKESKVQTLEFDVSLTQTLQITKQDEGYKVTRIDHPLDIRIKEAFVTIEDSLFLSGKREGISDKTIMELTNIYGWDIDFMRDIREGDTFSVIYEEKFKNDIKVLTGAILASEFVNQGHRYLAFRHTHEDGQAEYYNEKGHAMRKAFLKTPVEFSRISSGFSLNRRHPVLNTIRAHKGVDYAAPTGTPIKTTSEGRVEFIGTRGGYGKTVIVKHGSQYSTLYAHMSRYAKGLKKGSRVKQGQVIGYIGKTGLATGPHLHYEFRVHGVHRNPLTYKFPQAESIPSEQLAQFQVSSMPLALRLEKLSKKDVLVASQEIQE